ncbi:MAG: hypothetical protein Q9163_006313, partial [Psora crenata]
VSRKFADVLTSDTRVVDVARVSAAVKSAHMSALKPRLSAKKTARTTSSSALLAASPPADGDSPNAAERCEAHDEVSFANTPFKAAQAPLAAAMGIHGAVVVLRDRLGEAGGRKGLRVVGPGEDSGEELRS